MALVFCCCCCFLFRSLSEDILESLMSKLFFFFSYQNLYFCQLNVVGWRFLMNKETKALLSSCLTPKAPIPTGFYICIYRVLYLISSFFFLFTPLETGLQKPVFIGCYKIIGLLHNVLVSFQYGKCMGSRVEGWKKFCHFREIQG